MGITKEQKDFLKKVIVRNQVRNGQRIPYKVKPDGKIDILTDVNFYKVYPLQKLPFKLGVVYGHFHCRGNELYTLENFPDEVHGEFSITNNQLTSLEGIPKIINYTLGMKMGLGCVYIGGNNLTDYFKNIKEGDFPHWDKLYWGDVIREYPFLINIGKKYM